MLVEVHGVNGLIYSGSFNEADFTGPMKLIAARLAAKVWDHCGPWQRHLLPNASMVRWQTLDTRWREVATAPFAEAWAKM